MTYEEKIIMNGWYCDFIDNVYKKEVIYINENVEKPWYYTYEYLSLLTDLLWISDFNSANETFEMRFNWLMYDTKEVDNKYVKRIENIFIEYFNDVENFYGIDDRIMKVIDLPIMSNKFKCFLLNKMERKDNRFDL